MFVRFYFPIHPLVTGAVIIYFISNSHILNNNYDNRGYSEQFLSSFEYSVFKI